MADAIPLDVRETRRIGEDLVVVGTPVFRRSRRGARRP
jgi:hypothetical protein